MNEVSSLLVTATAADDADDDAVAAVDTADVEVDVADAEVSRLRMAAQSLKYIKQTKQTRIFTHTYAYTHKRTLCVLMEGRYSVRGGGEREGMIKREI